VSAPAAPRTTPLVATGLVAGFASALLGVGGGFIVVPLLLRFARFDVREASATSLAALLATTATGATVYAVLGHVHYTTAALVGLPAVGGTLVGTALQRRLSLMTLELLLAALLGVVAIRFLV
jgi:uncharacterized protein